MDEQESVDTKARNNPNQITAEDWAKMSVHARHELLDSKAPDIETANKERLISGLCRRCTNAVIYRRDHGEPVTICRAAGGREVPNDISDCTSYSKPGEMSLYEMGKVALLIDVRELPGGGYI